MPGTDHVEVNVLTDTRIIDRPLRTVEFEICRVDKGTPCRRGRKTFVTEAAIFSQYSMVSKSPDLGNIITEDGLIHIYIYIDYTCRTS